MDSNDIAYRAITISSTACSGATTMTNALSNHLGWPIISPVSQTIRAYLAQRGMSLSDSAKVPDEVHVSIDMQVKRQIEHDKHKLFLGRTTGWLAYDCPDVFKIFVTAAQDERIARYATRENLSKEAATKEIITRDEHDLDRYQKLYQIDYTDSAWYDLVVDTTTTDAHQTLQTVLSALTSD